MTQHTVGTAPIKGTPRIYTAIQACVTGLVCATVAIAAGQMEPNVVLACANVAVGLGMLVYCAVHSSRLDFFSPSWAFPIAYLILLTVGALAAPGTISLSQWMIYEIGILGYFVGLGSSSTLERFTRRLPTYHYSQTRSTVLLAIFGAVGFLSIASVYMKTGIPILKSNVNMVRYDVSQNAYVATLGNLLSISTVLAYTFSIKQESRSKLIRTIRFLAILAGLAFAITTGSRNALLKIILMLAVVHHYTKKMIPFKSLLWMGLAATVFVGGVGLYRNFSAYGAGVISRFGDGALSISSLFNAVWHFAEIQFSISSQNLSRLMEVVPEFYNYQYGYLFTAPFILWLPGEQMKAGVVAKEAIGGDWTGGASITLVGSFFFDLGYTGVILGMAFVGFLLGLLHKLARNNGSAIYLVLYAFLTYNALVSIRSNFMKGFDVVFYPACFLLFHLLCYEKPRPPSAEIQEGASGLP